MTSLPLIMQQNWQSHKMFQLCPLPYKILDPPLMMYVIHSEYSMITLFVPCGRMLKDVEGC